MTAITNEEYHKFTSNWWHGKKVRALQDFHNGVIVVPAGKICTIKRKYQGFDLVSDPCEHCGVQVYINRVGFWELELI